MAKEGLFNVVELDKYRLRYKKGKGTGKWHYITYYCKTHNEFEEIFNKYLNDKSLCYVEEVKSNGTN